MQRPFFKTDILCDNIQPDVNTIHVQLPNSSRMTSTQTGIIPITGLSLASRHSHLFPYLKIGSLLSIGQLCDSGCVATFNKDEVNIQHNNQLVANVPRTKNKLWTRHRMQRPFFKTDILCDNIQPDVNTIHVQLPNSSRMTSTQTGIIPITGLSLASRHSHLFPYLKIGSLLSIGQLCDSGCVATFNKDEVNIQHNNQLVANVPRTKNKLWTKPIPASNMHHPHISNLAMSTLAVKTAQDRVAFLNAAAGYPVLLTWLNAIYQGFFATWTGLSVAIVKRHLPKSYITSLSHLDQQHKNTQSTQPKIAQSSQSQQSILAPTATDDNNKILQTHNVFASCENIYGKKLVTSPDASPLRLHVE